MNKFITGDKVKVLFNSPLPGNDIAPDLKVGAHMEVFNVFTDAGGYDHIDVGLVRQCNFVTSFATGETLPGNVHWCHPNRFVKM